MGKERVCKVSTLLSEEEIDAMKTIMVATNSSKSKVLRDALGVYSWLITASLQRLEGDCDVNDILPPDVTLYLSEEAKE